MASDYDLDLWEVSWKPLTGNGFTTRTVKRRYQLATCNSSRLATAKPAVTDAPSVYLGTALSTGSASVRARS
jgi:hypothetical protein